jgi:hypothetical protein
MSETLNFDVLERLLLEASRAAFSEIQEQHTDETFYAFSLLHEPLWAYIIPPSNTEEGLIRRAQEYQLDKKNLGYAAKSIEQLARELRWNPADWEYVNTGNEHFKTVNEWLTRHDIYDRHRSQKVWGEMILICQRVLSTLDHEGLFGTGERREHVTLNIMMYDQDSSILRHAKALNPQSVYERFLVEIA